MDYELLLKLKNAGFPFPVWEGEGLVTIFPSVNKLIKECGDKFGYLSKVQGEDKFMACPPGGVLQCFGETPEEAVSRLYLALNEK